MLKYRILYIITLAAAVLFYLYYAGYLSFFILVSTVLLPIVSWLLTILAVRKTSIRFELKNPYANKNEEIVFHIIIKNNSVVPIARIGVNFSYENSLCGEKRSERIFLPVGSGPEQVMEYRMKSQYCGKITMELTGIKLYDFFGIFKISLKSILQTQVFVAPKLHFLDTWIEAAANPGDESSTYSKVKPGDDPSEIFDIRPYRSGDRLRSIHWKLSSKLDELMVKEFSLPTDSSVLLMVDLMAFDMASLDTVVEAFTSLSRFLLENEIKHKVEWYSAEHSLFQENEIENEEDLAVLLNAVLSARRYRDEPYTLACRNRLSGTAREYPHVIYVTGCLTDMLTAFCDNRQNGEKTTILYCGTTDESQQKIISALSSLKIEVIKLIPEKIQESLSGLTI